MAALNGSSTFGWALKRRKMKLAWQPSKLWNWTTI
jgi:hypothetical protein